MKAHKFLLGIFALAAIAISCDDDEDLALPAMSTDQTTLYFGQEGGAAVAQSLYITSNRDWEASCGADWVVISPLSGKASENAVEVTVYVDANTGTDRTATIEFISTTITTEVTVSQTGPAGSVESTYVYSNDFDKEAATQSYGSSGSSWPYLDQFDGWKNATGSGISTVSYNYNNLSVRNNSNSNGNYSEYDGSGTNNIFFGSTTNYFVIQSITLPTGTTNYSLSFGSEKYLADGSSVFSHDEFHVYLSDNGSRWVEISYTFPEGDRDALWDYASTTFTLPSGTTSLYIYFTADVASAYRLDDVLLATNFEEGTAIDFSTGVTDLPGSGEGTGGGDEGGDHELVGDGTEDNPYTAADANWLGTSGTYTDDEVYVKGIISQIDEISTSYGNATYYISDDGKTTEQFEIYRGYSLDGAKFTSSTEIEVGDKVVVCGVITVYTGSYGSTIEMTTGSKIVSLEKGEGNTGGGDEGGDEDEGDLVYGNDFDASVVSSNTTITSSVTAYQNETGSGASDISYNWSSKMSVRVSNGSAGAYTNASGNNNIFFGAEDAGYFVIKNIALPSGETNYKLTFGAREDSNVFASGTFKLYVSQDNAAWVQLTYDFPSGNTSSGSWALASTTFTVPSGTSTLYIYYEADVQSVYRIDDMRLTVSSTSGTSIDFSTGVTLEGGDSGEGGDGGDEGGDTPDTDGDGTVDNPYSASEALAIINAGTYTSSSVYIKGIISNIDEISTSYGNATYYISDDGTTSNHLEVYRGYSLGGEKFTSEDEIKVGDEVIVYGVLTMYTGSYGSTPEVTTGSSIYSLNGQTYDSPEYGDDDPFAQNVTWTLGSHASNDKAYINGSADTYSILKLGTSTALGDASCTVPAGTKALHFYCIAWNNGGPAPFTVTVGSTSYENTATAHSGLASSSPYTIGDISDSDYFEITFDELSADTTVKVETTSDSYPRVGVIGFKYITD